MSRSDEQIRRAHEHMSRADQTRPFTPLSWKTSRSKRRKGMDAFVKRFALCCGITNRTADGYDCFNGLEQTYKFARRARDYARIYRGGYSVASVIDIERIRKKKKSHRGALDQSTSFVSQEVERNSWSV